MSEGDDISPEAKARHMDQLIESGERFANAFMAPDHPWRTYNIALGPDVVPAPEQERPVIGYVEEITVSHWEHGIPIFFTPGELASDRPEPTAAEILAKFGL